MISRAKNARTFAQAQKKRVLSALLSILLLASLLANATGAFAHASGSGALSVLGAQQSIFATSGLLRSSLYPNHSEKAGDVTLSKDAEWVAGNGTAEVALTVDGLENVLEQEVINDVLFVLDTSGSMGSAGRFKTMNGCVNEDHGLRELRSIRNNLSQTASDANALNALIQNEVTAQNITLASGTDLHTFGDVINVDPNVKIPIPSNLYPQLVAGNPGKVFANSDLYLVPMVSQFTLKATQRLWFEASTSVASTMWGIVDMGPSSYFDPAGSAVAHHYYHTDESNNRVFFEVPSPNDATEKLIHTWPSTYDHKIPSDDVAADGTHYNNMYYDTNWVPAAWTFGKNQNCYQRANVLYDSVNGFADLLLRQNAASRVAFAAFNTSARGLDLDGHAVESQGHLDFTSN